MALNCYKVFVSGTSEKNESFKDSFIVKAEDENAANIAAIKVLADPVGFMSKYRSSDSDADGGVCTVDGILKVNCV